MDDLVFLLFSFEFRRCTKLPLAWHSSLILSSYAPHMLRVTAIVLALAVSFDYLVLDGRYTNAAQRMVYAILYSVPH
jgi:hypothetical protein